MTDPLDQLTPAERKCMELVIRHLQTKDIARAIGRSPNTVDKGVNVRAVRHIA